MCKHQWLHMSGSKVCKECGVELMMLRLDVYNVNSAPLERGYNRRQRFKIKVEKLLGLHSGPHYNDEVWAYLDKNRMMLDTPFDVRECLRASSLKHKHYDNVRTFCDAFTSFKVPHVLEEVRKYLMGCFDNLYTRWNSRSEETFFSYAWLLRYFLEKRKSHLTVYLKPRTCSRRHAKYLSKLELIQSPGSDGTLNCARLKTHSHCGLYDLSYPPIRQTLGVDQDVLVRELRGYGHFQTEGRPSPDLISTNSKAKDDILT